jgi:hypothetical protein
MLIALLLPAVQSAREAARRMGCSNKVRQLSLALHNFHDANLEFPAARKNWNSGTAVSADANLTRFSAFFVITPFFEQSVIYERFSSTIEARNAGATTPVITHTADEIANGARSSAHYVAQECTPWSCGYCIGSGYLDGFILNCPSEPLGRARDTTSNRTISYHFCYGDSSDQTYPGLNPNPLKNNRGFFTAQVDEARTMGSIADGTSNTIVFSEVCVSLRTTEAAVAGRLIKSGLAAQTNNATSGAFTSEPTTVAERTGNVQTCWGLKSGNTYSSATTSDWNSSLGRRWSDAGMVWTGFVTCLPPNGPSCAWSSSDSLVTASSYHSGGVVVGLGDGSVRFITETVDCGNPATANVVASGQSEFGVWGAMGSIDGGEAKSP